MEEGAEEVVLLEDMIVMDAADVREEIEGRLPMEGAGPLHHRGVHLEDPGPEFHEVILGAVMLEGLPHNLDEILATDGSRLMSHPVGMELLDGGGDLLSRVGKERPLGNEVVEGQQDIPDIKDDGLNLHHK